MDTSLNRKKKKPHAGACSLPPSRLAFGLFERFLLGFVLHLEPLGPLKHEGRGHALGHAVHVPRARLLRYSEEELAFVVGSEFFASTSATFMSLSAAAPSWSTNPPVG